MLGRRQPARYRPNEVHGCQCRAPVVTRSVLSPARGRAEPAAATRYGTIWNAARGAGRTTLPCRLTSAMAKTGLSHILSHVWDNADQHATIWPEQKPWSGGSLRTERTRTDGLEPIPNEPHTPASGRAEGARSGSTTPTVAPVGRADQPRAQLVSSACMPTPRSDRRQTGPRSAGRQHRGSHRGSQTA